MTPFAILTSHPAVLAGLAFGLTVSLSVHAQVYHCGENGQATYSDRPCGTRAKPVPPINNAPNVADQKAACERANTEAAEVQQMETVYRKAQVAEDAHETQMAAQVAEQARRDQRQKVVVTQEGTRYYHRVYVGPLSYP